MQGLGEQLISILLLLPLLGALAVALIPPSGKGKVHHIVGVTTASLTFLLSLLLLAGFNTIDADYQFVERARWIPQWGIQYLVGIDGLSLFLLLLTTLLTPLVLLSSAGSIQEGARGYVACMLTLETGIIGSLVALDLFLFYVFWELMLIPMFFLIGLWGGPRRVYATVKFLLFTMAGSLLMLVAVLVLYAKYMAFAGVPSAALTDLLELSIPRDEQMWLFAAFALAFAIKVPLFPLHTWLPDAHVEAPTGGSVILAGVLLKLGTYGFLRFAIPLFPEAAQEFAPLFLALAVIGIVYGALVALAQEDMKRLVAYSSISHLGFVVLGIFSLDPMGVSGALFAMVSHGLTTGALFLLVGALYERRHTREISQYGGLASRVPKLATFFVIVTLGSIGLPGLSGFVGEFLVILSAAVLPSKLWLATAVTGVLLGAWYMLTLVLRVFHGPLTHADNKKLHDMDLREWCTMLPLVILIVWLGVYPATILGRTETAALHWMDTVHRQPLDLTRAPAPQRGVVSERPHRGEPVERRAEPSRVAARVSPRNGRSSTGEPSPGTALAQSLRQGGGAGGS